MDLTDFGFGPFAALFSLFAGITALVQLGVFVLLILVLLDLRRFLRDGSSLMGRVDRWLARQKEST
ncbi:MAG: hypothetical protein OXH51_06915 [Gemmatimonadetes bacterium]|nr:hypothetical protein [Gemmatimonadota bacterium]MCY3611247.1 hypothetical protein [Gemmatimonadota bacterium]MCY3676223.1 hypothetical protein [Gemmatimonadota bacterium]MYA40905.1 hypothetical protein [Gemmatimonadota bacterium]MYE93869.1 hypothetical protein [Gemmatimonadota bacterium]